MVMQCIDEEIIMMKRLEKKKDYNSFETGFYIDDEIIQFHRVGILDGKMSVMLPREFRPMQPEIARIKYPSEARPQLIMTSEDQSVNFTFSLFEAPILPEETKRAAEEFRTVIKSLNPANIFYELQAEMPGENGLAWFDYQSYAVDAHIYNLMYVRPIEGKMLHGVFNCQDTLADDWKAVALQVVRSIVDLTERKQVEIR